MSLPHAILGFLSLGPSTGYELKKTFTRTVQHFWSADQSQIYRTLARIVARRWARTELVRQSSRPNKKVYTITEAGREEFLRWMHSPPPQEDPHVAPLLRVFFAGALPDAEVAGMLEGAAAQFGAELGEYRSVLRDLDAGSFHPLSDRDRLFWRATVEYGIAVTRAQKTWAEALRKRLLAADGRLTDGTTKS